MKTVYPRRLIFFVLFVTYFFTGTKTFSEKNVADASSFSALGSIGGGANYTFSCFPHCGDMYGTIQAQFLLQCKLLGTCTKYNLGFLRSELLLSFSNDPRGEADPSTVGSLPDYHIPYGLFSLRTVEFQFTPRLYVSFGNFSLSRAHYYLKEALNAQGTLGLLSIRFGTLSKHYAQGGCSLGLAGPGFKSIRYSTGAIPFDGLYALGFQQDCQLVIGNQDIQTLFSYSLQSTLSVGQSGAGNSLEVGPFGALASENSLILKAGLFVKAPHSWQQKGITGFSIEAPFTFSYHMNRGCLLVYDQDTPTCSDNVSKPELRVPILFNLFWGPPQTKSSVGLASEWLAPSRFTPSQGL